jgi:hypothetical protein
MSVEFRMTNSFVLLVKLVCQTEIRMSKLKTGTSSFGGEKTIPHRLRCSPPATFFAKFKSKKTHNEVAWKPWAPVVRTLLPPLGHTRPLSIAPLS